jgi:hypothetical protein
MVVRFQERAIIICAVMHLAAFLLMFIHRDTEENGIISSVL